ncbi:class I tRNA ligase family protein, partial [bacterium]|nr:class I tRNA ligase family protein [bacterium]
MEDDKVAAYMTLYEVLLAISKLCAPYAPYLSEEIYQSLTEKESVHLEDYPEHDEELIQPELEKEMQYIINIVSLARAARNEVQIKIRQPLRTLYVPEGLKDVVERMKSLIVEEINIHDIEFVKDKTRFMDYTIKPDYKVLGPKYGKHMSHIAQALQNMDANHLIDVLNKDGAYHLDVDTNEIKITKESLQIETQNKEGFVYGEDGGVFVALDTRIDDELLLEGNARELVNKIQFMRKEEDFDIINRIKISYYTESDDIKETFKKFADYIKKETLTVEIVENENSDGLKSWNVNGKEVLLRVKTTK